MSEREEIGISTILGIACGRIQCLTLKAWCVACRENESARVEKCGYMFDKSIPFLGGGEGRLPRRSGISITRGKAGQPRSCRIKGPPHTDVCPGTCWHYLFVWESLQWASEINDILTSKGKGQLLPSLSKVQNTSRQKCREYSDKQEMCCLQITEAWQ